MWMRALVGLCVLLTALLAGCSGSAPPPKPAPTTSSAAEAPLANAPKCRTPQLAARLGDRTDLGSGQGALPLIYTNTSKEPCLLRGAPVADLHGPADQDGAVYSLLHDIHMGRGVVLQPGQSASARLVILSGPAASTASAASTMAIDGQNWVPTELVTTPPGETADIVVPWPPGLSVTRQVGTASPGSWVESFTAAS
jgi:hypothetical protein